MITLSRFAGFSRLLLLAGCLLGVAVLASLPACGSSHLETSGRPIAADTPRGGDTAHRTADGVPAHASLRESARPQAEAGIPAGKSPKYVSDEEGEAPRRDFPETLYVNHRLITDPQGRATVEIPRMPDSITTWKVRAQAHTADGAFGEGSATFRVFQELFLNLQMPRILTVGDVVEVPLAVMNYGEHSSRVTVEVQKAPYFELDGTHEFRFDVEPEGVNQASATIRMLEPGEHEFYVEAHGDDGRRDALAVPVRVEPAGIARSVSKTVRVAGTTELDLPFPRLALDNASPEASEQHERNANRRVVLTVQPASYHRLLEARQALIRMPTGCFEQSLSQTLVNVEIARSYRDEAEPEIFAQAREQLALDYQRLLTFYDGEGHFASFPHRVSLMRRGGVSRWDRWLGGYALYVLAGLAEFVEVDGQLLATVSERFVQTHLERGETTAQALFGLWGIARWHAHSGERMPSEARLRLNRLRDSRPAHHSAYQLALLLNVFGVLGEEEAYQRTLDALFSRFPLGVADEEFELPAFHSELSRGRTVTGARGRGAAHEVAALVLLGTTHDDDPGLELLRDPLRTALLAELDARGIWRTTFATGIAMRALALLERQGGHLPRGTLSGSFNGAPFQPVHLGQALEEGRMVQLPFEAKRSNKLTLATDGSPVDVRVDQHMVFPDSSAFPMEARAFDLRVTPGSQTLTLGESTTLRVELERRQFEGTHLSRWWPGRGYTPRSGNAEEPPEQLIVRIGLPGTFRVFEDVLEQMVAAERLERYEISGREVRLYLAEPSEGFAAELTILPTAAGTVSAPVSWVQEYYNPGGAGMAPPLTFQVTR